jgi:methylated-DNA-[protein]-cysteine S-methyltransferase
VASTSGSPLDLKGVNISDFLSELKAEFGVAPVRSEKPFKLLIKELRAYFSGEPVLFTTRLDVTGTAFQMRVWSELMKIPYGNVRSYKWLARMAGNPQERAPWAALNRTVSR